MKKKIEAKVRGDSIDEVTPFEWDNVNLKNNTRYNASKSGAEREALGIPYLRLVPLEAMAAAAASFEYGANKYSPRNWEKGLPWQQMIDSLKRHIDDFERGKDYDDAEDGSGLHQVCMIMASASMLSASVVRGLGEDDRLTESLYDALTAKECANWIQDQLLRAKDHSKNFDK
jgi:hypothetical protein